jgi:hypothetical protein
MMCITCIEIHLETVVTFKYCVTASCRVDITIKYISV